MKATDLMINDLVQCEGCSTPSVVAGITPGKIHTWWADGTKHAKDEVYFTPIPLTAEILEKNHFIRLEDGSDEPWYVYNDLRVRPWCDGVWMRVSYADCMNFYGGSATVHELQHAMRLCGLNKLADNFKI